jgi:hypothetical protein
MAQNYRLFINSKDRTIGTATDFTVSFKEKILLNPNAKYHAYVESAEIPFTFYGVNSTNNRFRMSIDGGATFSTVTLTTASYTTDTAFRTSLQNSLGNGITVTYSTTKGTLTFTHAGGVNFVFDFATLGGNCASVLGFDDNGVYAFTTTLTSTKVANFFTPYEKLYIRSSLSTLSYDTATLSKSDILEKIQIGNLTPFNQTIYHRATEPYKGLLTQQGFDTLYIKLTDIRNRPIDLNGQDWNLCIVIEQA